MSSFRGQYTQKGFSPATASSSGAWMRDRATLRFLFDSPIKSISVSGHKVSIKETDHSKLLQKDLSLELLLNKRKVGEVIVDKNGKFSFSNTALESGITSLNAPNSLEFKLKGVGLTNNLAFSGRILKGQKWIPAKLREWLQPFRRQHNNRQILIGDIRINDELLIDFECAHSVFEADFILKHSNVGVNVLGWFHGYLGVGESARACARAAQSVGLKVDPVLMNLHLNGGQSHDLWESLVDVGKHPISIAHVDAPQSFDLAKRHKTELSPDKYRIGYWAWELPDFPDHWIQYAKEFDEIWCPSEFCREALGSKLPVPVLSMPHSICIQEPEEDILYWRTRFQLPSDHFLFLFTFDLNSYSPRKNPQAVIEAYKLAIQSIDKPVGLVLKMHGKGYDQGERELLSKLQDEIEGLYIVDEMLDRRELTGLQYACDSFVSLHRSEGFGLGVAEMMALGKPVISTNWSATSEFVNEKNGCPVDYELIELQENVGPYTKGQIWADASIEHASEWMIKLASDHKLSTRLGQNAKMFINRYYSPKAIGEKYLSRIKSIALFQKN